MWPVNCRLGLKNSKFTWWPWKGPSRVYWSLSKTVVLLEAARLSNSSRFSLFLGFRLQIKTGIMMAIANSIVPAMARSMISFFDSIIGIKASVVFSVVLVLSSVVKTEVVIFEVEVTSWVVSSVEVRVVNNSVLVKKIIFVSDWNETGAFVIVEWKRC